MVLGIVIGTVVATQKDKKLTGGKLLVVQEMGTDGTPKDRYAVAMDSVGAGVGDVVLVTHGGSARMTEVTKSKPIDSVIMAIVDSMEVHGKIVYQK